MSRVDAMNTLHPSESALVHNDELVQKSEPVQAPVAAPTGATGTGGTSGTADVVHIDHLAAWVNHFGEGLGLHLHPKSLPACWGEHSVVIHEITGLYLAWSALMDMFNPSDPFDDLVQVLVPAPRDWLDLANASAPVVERIKKDVTLCARSGRHVG